MSKIVPSQSVKRSSSPIADESGSGSKKRSREQVEIMEDVWLEALKHLSCPKWSKMRLVSHHLNGVVERNVSRLPMAIIDNVAMRLRVICIPIQFTKNQGKMIISDSTVSQDEQDQWFKDCGINLNVPAGIELNNAIIGVDLNDNCCIDLCVLGPAQGDELTPDEKTRPWFFGQQFKTNVLFYAEFSPHRNPYSWASMTFFLKLLYDQSTYVKKVSMFGLGKKWKENLFADEEDCNIRCRSFTIQVTPCELLHMPYANIEDLCESVSWLEKNVQADNVQFPNSIHYNQDVICDAMCNYLLGSFWISASQVVELGEINDAPRFFGVLTKKFPIVAVQNIFPTVVYCGYRPLCCKSLSNQLSGRRIVKEKLDDPEDDSNDSQSDETYSISNGSNQMRIEFIRFISIRCVF